MENSPCTYISGLGLKPRNRVYDWIEEEEVDAEKEEEEEDD